LTVRDAAKVAKPAKAEQDQERGVANPLLKPAKGDSGPRNFSNALAELSQGKTAESLDFSSFSRFSHFSRLFLPEIAGIASEGHVAPLP
jgi:hypothetical protein